LRRRGRPNDSSKKRSTSRSDNRALGITTDSLSCQRTSARANQRAPAGPLVWIRRIAARERHDGKQSESDRALLKFHTRFSSV
jgi:hypothetical protein